MTQKTRTINVWVLTLAMAGVAAGAFAQTPPTPPPASAPGTPQAAPDRYIVGQAKPPEVPGQTMMNLSIDDAIQRALDRNIDLKVARYRPQLDDYSIRQTKAAYMPTFSETTSYRNSTQLTTNTTELSSQISTRNISSNFGVSQTTPWHGAQYNFSFQTNRQTTTSVTSTRPLNYGATFNLSATQPILRNFKIDNTRTTLKTQQITRDIDDINLKTSIANTIASVRNSYWDLRSAIENIEIQRRALALATTLVEQNRTKVEIGTMAQIDVITAESQQANAELNLVNAESSWRTAELNFKKLIAGGTDDDIFKATINPTDVPTIAQVSVDIPVAIQNALSQRTDLAAAKKTIESANLNIELLKNQVLPDLNLTASYAAQGAGGNLYRALQGTFVIDPATSTLVTQAGYFDAITGSFQQPTWNFSAQFSYPLGQVAARANLARNRLSLEQQQTSLKATELTVSTDVANAGLAVQNAFKAMAASAKARELADRQAEAEQTKFDVGMSTNFTVVQQQQAQTSARLAELRAMITYVKALIEFERVQNVGR
jgi:outer membrane protein TolC